jgi:hypothetical protein
MAMRSFAMKVKMDSRGETDRCQTPTVQAVNKTGHETGRVFISTSPAVGDEDRLAFTMPPRIAVR